MHAGLIKKYARHPWNNTIQSNFVCGTLDIFEMQLQAELSGQAYSDSHGPNLTEQITAQLLGLLGVELRWGRQLNCTCESGRFDDEIPLTLPLVQTNTTLHFSPKSPNPHSFLCYRSTKICEHINISEVQNTVIFLDFRYILFAFFYTTLCTALALP